MNGNTEILKENTLELLFTIFMEDDGCELFPACLECPREVCRYDGIKVRNNRIKELYQQGIDLEELARRFRISLRHTYRIVKGR